MATYTTGIQAYDQIIAITTALKNQAGQEKLAAQGVHLTDIWTQLTNSIELHRQPIIEWLKLQDEGKVCVCQWRALLQ